MRRNPDSPSSSRRRPATVSRRTFVNRARNPAPEPAATVRWCCLLGAYQLSVGDAVRPVRVRALSPLEILGVIAIRALEPDGLGVAFESKDVRGNAVEEPAVVGNHHCAAGEIHECFL